MLAAVTQAKIMNHDDVTALTPASVKTKTDAELSQLAEICVRYANNSVFTYMRAGCKLIEDERKARGETARAKESSDQSRQQHAEQVALNREAVDISKLALEEGKRTRRITVWLGIPSLLIAGFSLWIAWLAYSHDFKTISERPASTGSTSNPAAAGSQSKLEASNPAASFPATNALSTNTAPPPTPPATNLSAPK
jgi:hypothetical protein